MSASCDGGGSTALWPYVDKAGEGTESGEDGAEGELREGCKSESETRYHEPELDDLRTEAIQFIAAVITRLGRAGLQLGRVAAREGAKEGQMVARRWPGENTYIMLGKEKPSTFSSKQIKTRARIQTRFTLNSGVFKGLREFGTYK